MKIWRSPRIVNRIGFSSLSLLPAIFHVSVLLSPQFRPFPSLSASKISISQCAAVRDQDCAGIAGNKRTLTAKPSSPSSLSTIILVFFASNLPKLFADRNRETYISCFVCLFAEISPNLEPKFVSRCVAITSPRKTTKNRDGTGSIWIIAAA